MVPPMGNRSVDPAATPAPEQLSPAPEPQQPPSMSTEQLPALPWRVPLDPAPWWAWALFVTPFIAVPALNSWLWMGARDMLAVGLLTIIGASVVRVAGGVVLYRVELTPSSLKARTSMLIRSLAWQAADTPVRRPRPGIGTLLVLLYLILSIGAFLLRWHIVV